LTEAQTPAPRAASADNPNPALAAMEDALELLNARLGLDHPLTLTTTSNLAMTCQAINKHDLAVPLGKEPLATARKTLPGDSPQLAQPLASLGLALLQAKAFADAEPLLRECLEARKNEWRPAAPAAAEGSEDSSARRETIPRPLSHEEIEACCREDHDGRRDQKRQVLRDAKALRAIKTRKAVNGKPVPELWREVDAKTRD